MIYFEVILVQGMSPRSRAVLWVFAHNVQSFLCYRLKRLSFVHRAALSINLRSLLNLLRSLVSYILNYEKVHLSEFCLIFLSLTPLPSSSTTRTIPAPGVLACSGPGRWQTSDLESLL